MPPSAGRAGAGREQRTAGRGGGRCWRSCGGRTITPAPRAGHFHRAAAARLPGAAGVQEAHLPRHDRPAPCGRPWACRGRRPTRRSRGSATASARPGPWTRWSARWWRFWRSPGRWWCTNWAVDLVLNNSAFDAEWYHAFCRAASAARSETALHAEAHAQGARLRPPPL